MAKRSYKSRKGSGLTVESFREGLTAIAGQLPGQYAAAIENARELERMMNAANVQFVSAFARPAAPASNGQSPAAPKPAGTAPEPKPAKGKPGRKRGSGGETIKSKVLTFLSDKPEASKKDICKAIGMNDKNPILTNLKNAKLLEQGASGQGWWAATAEGKKEATALAGA